MERPRADASDSNRHDALVSVWSVSDGRAGNVRQAEALANVLGPAHAVGLQPRWPWRALAPRRIAGSAHAFGADFESALDSPPSIAVGCGRQAALATRLLREHGSKVVQILDPRIDPGHWDVVVVPRHDGLHGRNVITSLGSLHAVDDLWLAQARAQFAAFQALPRPRTAVLLGGSSRHVRFDRMAFEMLATQLEAVFAHQGGSLLLSTSRRTSAELRDASRHRFVATPAVTWHGAQDGENPYPGMLAWADRIVCSPDSVNMISEACATGAPVHVFEPGFARGRLRAFLDGLLAIGRIRAVDGVLADFDVEPLRETTRIAGEVRERLSLP
jgi:mitochondrial fission protein ELM1